MAGKKSTKTKAKPDVTFPDALAKLLRARKIKVPSGLAKAPPDAYANQPASFVERLSDLDDATLRSQAEKIAGYAKRQAERAKASWDTSPLIKELKRRKLKEPGRPARVVGASISMKRPLKEWSDREILQAAAEWSKRGS